MLLKNLKIIFFVILFCSQAFAEAAKSNSFLVEIPESETSHVTALHPDLSIDYNEDGVRDYLHCGKPEKTTIKILDGKNSSKTLYSWTANSTTSSSSLQKLFTSCAVVKLHPHAKRSIVISVTESHNTQGMRQQTTQYLLYNNNGTFIPKALYVKKSNYQGQLQSGEPVLYRVAARTVQCAPYPSKLVSQGYHDGALCFFAGYDTLSPEDWTHTALIKIEDHNGDYKAFDLTPSSGLPWRGGVSGTDEDNFPTYQSSSGSTKHDGLHMMDGTFIDTNGDKLPELVSVGQHASVRLSTMKINTNRAHGIEYTTTNILKAQSGNMTEFLSVKSFGQYNDGLRIPCVYLSGELGDGTSSANVVDHVRCYEGSTWVRYNLPMSNFSSSKGATIIRPQGEDDFYLRVPRFLYRNGTNQFERFYFFKVR